MGKRVILIIFICIAAAAVIAAACLFLPKKQTNTESEAVLSAMEDMIPHFGPEDADYGDITGEGRDPLAILSINDIDIVGGLEIPSINLRVPVTAKKQDRPYFATWAAGSPVKGDFRIRGNGNDAFSRIAKCKPEDKVVFTDVDGVRYEYQVTTQFHIKKWDKAHYDLMLTYKTDSDTRFVLACTSVL